jgi:hypothetical protein
MPYDREPGSDRRLAEAVTRESGPLSVWLASGAGLGGSSECPTMLTEDDVVDSVQRYLIGCGWQVTGRAAINQHGPDLVATRGEQQLIIEAKGAGSSKCGTARYGQPFSSSQVFDHVAKAVLKALRVTAAGDAIGAIALPANEHHRSEVDRVAAALDRVGIVVFWVAEGGAASVEPSSAANQAVAAKNRPHASQ